MATQIRSTTFFGGEVKPSAPLRKIKWHIEDPFSMKRDTCRQNSRTFIFKFLPASLLGVSAGYCQRTLLGKSVMIKVQMGNHNGSVTVAVSGNPCTIPPHKQEQ
jgi:hypothetical protein